MDLWLKSGTLKRPVIHQDDENSTPSCSKDIVIAKKKRKYDPTYLATGFTISHKDGDEKPQCVLCGEILSNECMKPSKLRRHLETKHSGVVNKPIEFFKNKLAELTQCQNVVQNVMLGSNNEKAVLASYHVALLVAKKGQCHTIGEDLILPAAKVMTSIMLGDKYSKELSAISLSDNTVKRRIDDMAENVKDILIERINCSEYFSLQFDESTDIANSSNLMAFVRYMNNKSVKEDFLFCKSLRLHTTAEALFEVINDFFVQHKIDWSKCVGICTDGARAMSGKHKGLVARIQSVTPNVKWTHCSIHREALATRGMPLMMKAVLDESVKVINFIKSRPLNSRIFKAMCNEMGSDHEQLLLHSEVRWLSRGRVLTRLFELRDEVRLFLIDTKSELKEFCNNFSKMAILAYLADIFTFLNSLNTSLQSSTVNVFSLQDKIEATIKKLNVWSHRIDNNKYDSLPTLSDFLESNEQSLPQGINQCFKEHMMSLKTSLRNYFPSSNENIDWIKNPFLLTKNELSFNEEDQLLELSCDSSLKLMFSSLALHDFWLHAQALYPDIAKEAIKYLLPFTNTYLCESAFSLLVHIKNKYRNRTVVEPDLRLKISPLEPDIHKLVNNKQHQPSH